MSIDPLLPKGETPSASLSTCIMYGTEIEAGEDALSLAVIRVIASLLSQAERLGYIVEVERKPLVPLAMRNHVAYMRVYKKR